MAKLTITIELDEEHIQKCCSGKDCGCQGLPGFTQYNESSIIIDTDGFGDNDEVINKIANSMISNLIHRINEEAI